MILKNKNQPKAFSNCIFAIAFAVFSSYDTLIYEFVNTVVWKMLGFLGFQVLALNILLLIKIPSIDVL